MIRTDLSSKLVHLTRTADGISAEDRFENILAASCLKGSSKDVRGGYSVVAFSEAPISMLANVLAAAASLKMRYAPLGVMVDKEWLFQQGGRPVIYQPNSEFNELPELKQFLHARYQPDKGEDYSWEREWRIRTDKLKLDPTKTTVVVPSRAWADSYHEEHNKRKNITALVTRGFGLDGPPKWHFVALEDLGVPFDQLEPISFKGVK